MFFTLAVSAASPRRCAELADRARVADPAVMPIPGPAVVAWRTPDGRAALLHWGGSAVCARSVSSAHSRGVAALTASVKNMPVSVADG